MSTRNAKFLFWDYDPVECDICDEHKECVRFEDVLGKVVSLICIDCLKKAINEYER